MLSSSVLFVLLARLAFADLASAATTSYCSTTTLKTYTVTFVPLSAHY